ncbi:hypothetical protein Hanom_Chr11g01016911 [Helianthus anomalus]
MRARMPVSELLYSASHPTLQLYYQNISSTNYNHTVYTITKQGSTALGLKTINSSSSSNLASTAPGSFPTNES